MWPLERFPVLHDHARGEIVPESSIIIEYLARARDPRESLGYCRNASTRNCMNVRTFAERARDGLATA